MTFYVFGEAAHVFSNTDACKFHWHCGI